MRTNIHKTVELGDLVVAVFDAAARYSTDPREVSRLATKAVKLMLRRARKLDSDRMDARCGKGPSLRLARAVA